MTAELARLAVGVQEMPGACAAPAHTHDSPLQIEIQWP